VLLLNIKPIVTGLECKQYMFGLFAKKCPKCDSKNLKVVKPSAWKHQAELVYQLLSVGVRKPTPPLNVCRDCGFSWEDR